MSDIGGKICWGLLKMKHQKVIQIKIRDKTIKNMDKYALLKRFHHDLRLQVYMYVLIYVNPETMPVEEYFTATFFFKLQEDVNSRNSNKILAWIKFHMFRRLSVIYEL